MKKYFKLLAVVAVLSSTSAFAGTETFNDVIASQSVGFSDTLYITPFDTSLGTLTGVTVTLSTTGTAELDVTNLTLNNLSFTNGSAKYTVSTTVANIPSTVFNLTDNLTATIASGTVGAAVQHDLTAFGFGIVTSDTTVKYTGLSISDSATSAISSAYFSAFETAPLSVVFSVDATAGTYGGTSVSGLAFGGNATVGGNLNVVYTYTAATVPEPEQMALFLLGLPLIAGFARRKQAV